MRVIAGKFKGTKLVSPRGEVRPTTDLVKGSLFSMLTSRGLISGAKCLDVFCGSGALGIEAISRGADSCVFVDSYTDNVKANLDKLRLTERVIRADYRKALKQLSEQKFDLVFCDPPYKTNFAEETVKLLLKYGMLGENGVAVIEYGSDKTALEVSGAVVVDRRVFGVTAFEIVRGDNEGGICGSV